MTAGWRNGAPPRSTTARAPSTHFATALPPPSPPSAPGFVSHPANADLDTALAASDGTTTDLHRWLLRVAYRLIVLFVAEDRDLLHPADCDPDARSPVRAALQHRPATSPCRNADRQPAQRSVGRAPPRDRRTRRRRQPHTRAAWPRRQPLRPGAIGLLRESRVSATGTSSPPSAPFRWSPTSRRVPSGLSTIAISTARSSAAFTRGCSPTCPATTRPLAHSSLEQAAGNERKKSGTYYTPSDLIALVLDEVTRPADRPSPPCTRTRRRRFSP